jgi:hypothetical protein
LKSWIHTKVDIRMPQAKYSIFLICPSSNVMILAQYCRWLITKLDRISIYRDAFSTSDSKTYSIQILHRDKVTQRRNVHHTHWCKVLK